MGIGTARRPAAQSRAGFTLIELLIAMVMGVLVLTAAMSLSLSTIRNLAGTELRDGMARNARYVGASLQRDLSETGVNFDSDRDFGSLTVYSDTIAILRAPYHGDTAATPYRLNSNSATPGWGNCGQFCVRVTRGTAPYPPFEIAAGDLVVLQFGSVRRLLLVQSTNPVLPGAANATVQVTFFGGPNSLLNHSAGLALPAPGLLLNTTATIQEAAAVVYFRDAQNQLRRGNRLLTAGAIGAPDTLVLATGVQTFDASLIFTDGHEAIQAIGTVDADTTNDYNRIASIRVQATMRADRTDTRVNKGVLLTKNYEWRIAPRNLTYERNQ